MEFNKFLEIIILQVVNAVVPMLVTGIVGFVTWKVTELIKKLDPKTLVIIDWVVTTVVQAAEQSNFKGTLEEIAIQKKQYAVEQVKIALKKLGLGYIDVDTIEAAIEAAILKGLHKPNEIEVVNVEVKKEAV